MTLISLFAAPWVVMLWWLLVGHVMCDGPLQTGVLSNSKSSPDLKLAVFGYIGHAVLHGGAVALVTGQVWLGMLETLCHLAIDVSKRRGLIGAVLDQSLHMLCKILWVALIFGPMS
jgi:hypothetical protein